MNNTRLLALCGGLLLAILALMVNPLPAAPRKTEEQLMQMLQSPDTRNVIDALDRLPKWYPESTNALPVIKGMLERSPNRILQRRAARALGEYHAELGADEIRVISGFLRSQDPNEVMDGLKTLRELKLKKDEAGRVVEAILPLLQDKDDHIVRDSCRTLAVHGNQDTIKSIEPLLKRLRLDVKKDAQDAINRLRAKP
jgi:hypothetical protein